ncbi:unnamed protein product [Paramecium sonneborni]|uniref:Uncharacterized protein n=1 Tax=Paramecium sonneborni TaxID=65129 RepID=A0A8S1RDZ7_9CILI|nr:unnamed protein product [Paramecium sonneborni]
MHPDKIIHLLPHFEYDSTLLQLLNKLNNHLRFYFIKSMIIFKLVKAKIYIYNLKGNYIIKKQHISCFIMQFNINNNQYQQDLKKVDCFKDLYYILNMDIQNNIILLIQIHFNINQPNAFNNQQMKASCLSILIQLLLQLIIQLLNKQKIPEISKVIQFILIIIKIRRK